MPEYRIGAHIYIFIQFGYDLDDQFDEIFDAVADAGYQAIELSEQMLEVEDWKSRTDDALNRTGLGLIGVSTGQPMWDVAQYETIMSKMDAFSDELAAYANVTAGTSCGGKRYADRTDAENAQAIKVWSELGEMFRSKGVSINYHTHGEPIEEILHVVENVPADLVPLGPDLDWLRVGGVDPTAFIREHVDRIIMLHVRDYHIGGHRTEALGEGDADYLSLGRVLEEVGFDGEFAVELATPDKRVTTRTAAELLRVSRDHLRGTIG